VTRPNATFELVVKTAMPKGTTVPKGRINLPRQVKEKQRDIVAVFAEGRQADEAKRAGADHVGGAELADAVRTAVRVTLRKLIDTTTGRERSCSSYHLPLYTLPPPNHYSQVGSYPWSPWFNAFRASWYRNRRHCRIYEALARN
jgi:hypothetical protein